MTTDAHWESWGARDPYFGVLTHPRFRTAALTPEAREEFFASGRAHAQQVLDVCRQRIDPAFSPQRVLDFGCGVGRVLIPLAAGMAEAVGVDVSPSMLAEARRNCEAQGVANVALLLSDDDLSTLSGEFDLVHCCIVLQHIEVPRGRKLFQKLVERIRPGGIGALHVTFAWDIYADNFGQAPPPPGPGPVALARGWLREKLFGPPPAAKPPAADADPEMQMNFYNLSELMFVVQRAGATALHAEFTDHGGALGVFMFFRRA